jgi:integrase
MVVAKKPKWLECHRGKIRIRMQVRGHSYKETLEGDYYNPSDLRAAEKRALEIHSRLSLGIGLTPENGPKRTLFGEDCQRYIDQLEVKWSTESDYIYILNKHWLPVFSNRITCEITPKMIKAVLAKMDVSPKRKRNTLDPIRGVFKFAEIDPNPAVGIKIKSKQKSKIERFRPDERQAILEVIQDTGDREHIAYFALLFGCGLRPSGEPLALMWTDYDGEYINVNKGIVRRVLEPTTKTHEDRRVYVPEWVRPHINRLPSRMKGEWLFLNPNGDHYKDHEKFNKLWRKAFEHPRIKKKLRMPYRIPYVCRHTRAAELLSLGINPARAAKQLGHSVDMFLNRYSEWIDEFSSKKDDSDLGGVAPELPQKKVVF